jgi:DNA primase
MTARPAGTGGAAAASREDWVERVRAATDIVDLIGQTVRLRKAGRNMVGLCPFHKEKTPSFSVHPERQFYHCFSCKAGGDVFKFVQETENVGFLEAVELLSRRAGIAVPERFGAGSGAPGRRGRLLEALDQAAQSYEQWLADPGRGAEVRAYLEGRGVSPETARAFRLGLAPAGWENLAQRLAARLGAEVLIEAGLVVRRAAEGPGAAARGGIYDRFRNRLMVPLIATGGTVVGFGARALANDDPPKYLNSPETPVYHKGAFLFALDAARKPAGEAGELIVVEGYFDAIALHQAGLTHTVATSGTALTAEQARLIRRVAPAVALTYDGDAAGQEAMMRSLGVLLAEGLDVAVVELPAGTDPDSLIRARGLEGWQEARGGAYDVVAFIQRHVLRAGATGAAAAADPRERALQAVVELALQVGDEIRRRLLLERASRVFGIAEAVLDRAVELKRKGQRSDQPLEAVLRVQRSGALSLERQALQALLMAPEELAFARGEIAPADFEDPACAALAAQLWPGTGAVPEAEPEASLARELIAGAADFVGWATTARVAVLRLTIRGLLRESRRLEENQKRATTPSESDAIARQLEALHSKRLVREELWKHLKQQSPESHTESDPDQVMSDLREIATRATGQPND